ncbi:MAG: amidohydrolase [Flavobacteriaceae bacterium]|nr:amidohydrolase [Flavobacteriaceae bacterium]
MKKDLHISLVQYSIFWHNPLANKKQIESMLKGLKTDLVILPEMFSTGFSMEAASLAETSDGETIRWMQAIAEQLNAAITGSVIIKEQEHFFNRLFFVFPEGKVETYDKRHTFSLAGEDKIYTKGKLRKTITYLGWKILPQICYDLRFPVWARNTDDYHFLYYVANWPTPRVAAWDALLKARAIENMAYCVGVNRIGIDSNGMPYNGHSQVFDALGKELLEETPEKEGVYTAVLSAEALNNQRNKLRFLEDRDRFKLL